MKYDKALVWFRRDLRDYDHAALYHALKSARRVYCVFIFDRGILDGLEDRRDRRVEFIRESLVELDASLGEAGRRAGGPGGGLIVELGDALDAIPRLAAELGVGAVFVNRDYEPAAKRRDAAVAAALARQGVAFESFKDQAVFDGDELATRTGQPFSVFTPYRNAWLKVLTLYHLQAYQVENYADSLSVPASRRPIPSLAELGFGPTDLAELGVVPGMHGARQRLENFLARIDGYGESRDFPAIDGPSYLSVHLRFGTVSIRELAGIARQRWEHEFCDGAGAWLNELIWRDFYFMILDHHPQVVSSSFRPEYDELVWDDWPEAWAAWCAGRTGYPLVDAGMRQLNSTGYMHNRLRMVAASFLTKDLGIDWRRGEAYFAAKLLDYDLAANNGGWQWAASTGCDAQPYFRIFNPVSQSAKFDPRGTFIRRYCPELKDFPDWHIHSPWTLTAPKRRAYGLDDSWPRPIVDHAVARARTMARFKAVRGD